MSRRINAHVSSAVAVIVSRKAVSPPETQDFNTPFLRLRQIHMVQPGGRG
jgi:hypothetical protein